MTRVAGVDSFSWMLALFLMFIVGIAIKAPLVACFGFVLLLSGVFAQAALPKRFFPSLISALLGILVPLLVFLGSGFAGPSWKGECQYGWVDCFQSGKMALLPLVVWAMAAFHVAQVIRPEGKPKSWVVAGLFLGTVISAVCLAYYRLILPERSNAWWLIIPLVTLTWYGVLTCRAMVDHGVKPLSHLPALIISSPLGFASVWWSKDTYAALPNMPPAQCFIVTAASKGHEELVGPFTHVQRRGAPRLANRQLLVFWKLEALWKECLPGSHQVFRRFYNQMGPRFARRIDTTWKADAVYLALKPCELVAGCVVQIGVAARVRQTVILKVDDYGTIS